MQHFADEDEHAARFRGLFDSKLWREERRSSSAVVSSLVDGEGRLWLRVLGDFPPDSFDELADVLDVNLEKRQKEWHDLLVDGGGVRASPDSAHQVCYFAYRSPWPFSDRDCLYAKLSQSPDPDTLLLSYWTVQDAQLEPEHADRVRIDFWAAHAVVRGAERVTYDYVQWSDAKIMLPDVLLKSSQVKILLREVEGLRRAVSKK